MFVKIKESGYAVSTQNTYRPASKNRIQRAFGIQTSLAVFQLRWIWNQNPLLLHVSLRHFRNLPRTLLQALHKNALVRNHIDLHARRNRIFQRKLNIDSFDDMVDFG